MSLMGKLPIVLVVLTFLTFIVSYIIAVARNDVAAAFPYISDTGSERPESCIFGQFLNIAAMLAACTMFFHYKAVEAKVGDLREDPLINRLNKSAMVVGSLSSLGVSIVANFQEGTMVEIVHFIGASMAFLLGVGYCFLIVALSYQMYPCFTSLRICRIRLAMALAAVFAVLITVVAAVLAFHQWNKTPHTIDEKLKWSSDQPGYPAHVVSTVFEWVTACIFFMFFLTFVKELDKFNLEVKARPNLHNLDDYPETTQEPNERTKLIL